MSRNDGRPKSVVKLSLDPLPWKDPGGFSHTRYASAQTSARGKVFTVFDPRSGFIQDREVYE